MWLFDHLITRLFPITVQTLQNYTSWTLGYQACRKTDLQGDAQIWHHANVTILLLGLPYPWKANSHKSFLYLCTCISSTSIALFSPPITWGILWTIILDNWKPTHLTEIEYASAMFLMDLWGKMINSFINIFHSTAPRLPSCFI